ncbi:MAG TPA: DUF748 domain-containing protein [Candidatus Dormibacteraeota bacterium]|nr:DUF748 domain-containing protein [Candidatus Dormibacteraeota bacterium]
MTRRRLGIAAVAVLATLAVGAVALWTALPLLARWAVVRQVEGQTGRHLSMAAFDLDLRRGRLHIGGFRLEDREPGPPLAEFDRLEIRFRPGGLVRGHVQIEEITLVAPRVRIVRTGRGQLNISDLLGRRGSGGAALPFTLDRLALTDGAIVFEDRTLTPPRTWRADGLTVEAIALSTMSPEPRGSVRLNIAVAGAPLAVTVSQLGLAPLQARARLALRDMDATLANLYLPPDTAVVLEKAVVGAAIDATLDAQGGVGLDGQARIDDLTVRRRGVDTSLVTVPSLVFALTSARGPDGRLLGRVEVAGRATVFDPRPGRSNRFEIDHLKLVADGLDASGRAPARVSLTAALPGGGALDVQGTARSRPLGAALRSRISRVDLAFWAPYFTLPVDVAGIAESDLTIDVAGAGSLTARVRGRATLTAATVADGSRRLGAADLLEVSGLDAQWPKARVERVRLVRPRARLDRDREGRLSVAEVVESVRQRRPPDTAAPPAPARALPPDLALEIGEISIEDGRLRLDDALVEPPARLRIAPIRLTARDVTWPGRRPAQVEFSAATPEAGTVEARGTVSLDPLRFELRTRVAGVALAPFHSYVPLQARLLGRLDADVSATGTLGPRTEVRARGSVALSDLDFAAGDRSLLTVGRLEAVGLDYASPATLTIDRVHMTKSWVLVERRPDGSLPLREIFTATHPALRALGVAGPTGPPAAAAPAATPFSVTVRESVFEGGAASIVDAAVSPTARIEMTGAHLVARDFTWPARGPIPVRLEIPTPGAGRLAASGQLDIGARSLEMHVTPSGVDVAPAQPYLPLRGRIAGQASGDLQVQATFDPLAITVKGSAALADLALADGATPLATAQRLEATGLEYAWPATVVIDQVRMSKPWAQIERAADGSFPIRALLEPAAPPAGRAAATRGSAPAGSSGAAARLDVRVRRSAVEDGTFVIVDSTVTPPARAEIDRARLTLRNVTWPAREPTEVRLRAATGTGGSVEARGQVRLDTQALDVQLTLKQMDLATAQAFLPSRGTLAGKLDSELHVQGTLAPLVVAATGRLAVDDTIFGDGRRMLAYIKRVDVTGLDADWPRRVTIGRVAMDKPWALVERDPDGSLPLLALLLPGSTGAPAGSAPGPAPAASGSGPRAGPAPIVQVGALAVDEGFIRFVDRTTTPAFTEEASRIVVTGRGLGTAPDTRGQLDVAGRLTGGAPFEVKSTLGALGGPLNFELQGTLTNFPLSRVNPYSNKLIGWVARRGAFSTTVRYRVVNDQLEATNEVVLGQPDFSPSRSGDAVREKVGVPFSLLISLLKNARGEVRLSVPVTGNVAAREFDMTEAFWAAVKKTAIGVMALPVSWVGKIFYTEDARVDTIQIWPVYFEPGTTRFTRGFDQHADRLSGFLKDAPGVNLAMKPILTVDDLAALKREAVRQRIDAAARESGQTADAVAARLFAERYPGRPAPGGGPEAVVAELVKAEPSPDAAAKTLVTQRMETTRSRLQARGGVAPERLRSTDGMVPVEGSGLGRVEFEIAP